MQGLGLGRGKDFNGVMLQAPQSTFMLATVRLKVQQPRNYTFSMASITPPDTAVNTIMQRGDEVNTILRMLTDVQTSAVILTGDAGAGKSLLAALAYRRLELTAQAGLPAPRHFVWLSIGAYTTLPDVIASILSGLNASEPGFFLLKSEQQISTLLRVLRRRQEPALVVLDQFEELLDPETNTGLEGRGDIALFLEMLLQDLGLSRVLFTCTRSPYDPQYQQESRIRSYLISRMSLPEGVALLQQRGVQGTYEELSLIWQRCGGHVFSLILFNALFRLSGFALSYLLNAPDYQPMWSSEVPQHLLAAVYHHLNPIQHTLIRILSLFREPVPTRGISMTIVGEDPTAALQLFERELQLMVQLSLVQRLYNQGNEPCYCLHPLFRQYVLEHYLEGSSSQPNGLPATSLGVTGSLLLQPGSGFEAREAQEVAVAAGYMRITKYYQQLAQEHYLPPEKRGSPQDIEFLLATIRHLCLGWHWQDACDLILSEGIYESMVQWGAWNTLIGLYQGMLPPNGVLTRRDEGLICNHLGLLYDRLDNAQQSWAFYERALALQRKIGDLHGVALTLTNEGELFRNQREWKHAYANFEQARELNQQLRDPLLESVLLHNLGLLHHAAKDYPQALKHYQEALRFALTLEEHYNEGMILTNIGVMFYEQGFYPEALAVLFYTLQMRQALQHSTVSFIESFIATLEDNMEIDAFARLRQASREVEERVISRLMPANMRQ